MQTFYIQLYGVDQDGKPKLEPVGQPFADLKLAIAKGGELARGVTCPWGKPKGFQVVGDNKNILHKEPL